MLKTILYSFALSLTMVSFAKENTATKENIASKEDKKQTDKEKPATKLSVGAKAPSLPADTKKLSFVSERKPWTNSDYEGKVSILFYVAPGEKDLNSHATDAIREAVDKGLISRDYYSSFAVVNMAASGWPNFLIAIKLKQSQREFPTTTYIKDYDRVLVEKWGLTDNSNCALLFDTDGTLLFRHDGKIPDDGVKELVSKLKNATQRVAERTKSKKTTSPGPQTIKAAEVSKTAKA